LYQRAVEALTQGNIAFMKLAHARLSNTATARWSTVATTATRRCEYVDWNKKLYSGELMTRRIDALNQMVKDVRLLASSAKVSVKLSSRIKSFESTWRKMQGRKVAYQSIFDFVGIRVIVDNVAHCYQLLERVHDSYAWIPGRERDYIVSPKQNGYQSLHTTVRNSNGVFVEVQLRTPLMHQYNEEGQASHRAYKASTM
jgi:(p)ppGpp synthase/HD superfamily hydrolase